MAKKEEVKKQLIAKMARIIKKASPEVDQDIYQDFILKFVNSLLSSLETYRVGIRVNKNAAEETYAVRENQLVVDFLQAVPQAIGGTQDARPLVEANLTRVLEKAGLELSDSQLNALIERVDMACIAYAGFMKQGDKEAADKAYEAYEDRILSAFTSRLSRAESVEAEKRLKERISHVLELTNIEVEDFEKRKAQDQLLWLFSDYINAPEGERERIYSLGEERIIFSLLDSTQRLKGELKSMVGGAYG
jgi:hypothetical protein